MLRTIEVMKYITPLREGGSMPAVVEGDDGFLYVLKFKGAGQGVKALISELIGGEIARRIGLKVPELVFANLDQAFGRTEPDEEIQDLLRFSEGLNLALHFLSGSISFDENLNNVDELTASKIVWLDAFLTNMDRTPLNTNMLMWHKELWLIDHGASLYFHHNLSQILLGTDPQLGDNSIWESIAKRPFPMIKDHVLLKKANKLEEVDSQIHAILTNQVLEEIVNLIPVEWLERDSPFVIIEELRAMYLSFLWARLSHSSQFVKESNDARNAII